jgi:hypothetical protein
LANRAIKPIRIGHTKWLGLIRQPRTGSILPVDGVSLTPVNNFSLPDIPNKTVSLLSKLTFDGGGDVSAKDHLNKFWCKCIKHDISDLKVLCRLFAFTFRGRIKHWFESFPAYHIFDWFQFVEEFLDAFENYDYNQLCEEF